MPRLVAGPPSLDAPSTYKLAPSEAFIPESVTATFDGSGAGGAFLPTLSVYSQDGKLLARCPATSIAAGDSAEVTFAPLLRAATSAGGGWQYNVDNTGGWGLLETIGNPNVSTSQPSSFTFGDTPASYSLAINSNDGTVFTNDPTRNLDVVTIESGVSGTKDASALRVVTAAIGSSGTSVGISGDINGGSGQTRGLSFGVGSSTALVVGFDVAVNQSSGVAVAPAIGVNGVATSHGSGDTIGLKGQAHALGSGLACALRCVDHTGASIFEVRDDGSVHILTGTAVIADL